MTTDSAQPDVTPPAFNPATHVLPTDEQLTEIVNGFRSLADSLPSIVDIARRSLSQPDGLAFLMDAASREWQVSQDPKGRWALFVGVPVIASGEGMTNAKGWQRVAEIEAPRGGPAPSETPPPDTIREAMHMAAKEGVWHGTGVVWNSSIAKLQEEADAFATDYVSRNVHMFRSREPARAADTARLDIIQRNRWAVHPDTGGQWTVWDSEPTGGGDYQEVELTRGNRKPTVREAIDAARAASGENTLALKMANEQNAALRSALSDLRREIEALPRTKTGKSWDADDDDFVPRSAVLSLVDSAIKKAGEET